MNGLARTPKRVARVELTVSFFALQRIRELEDRIDLQKRQIKEIEEKVPGENICRVGLRKVEQEVKRTGGRFTLLSFTMLRLV